jgi:uncharacterized membrane protein
MKSYTFGEKCADLIASFGGSWPFLIIQSLFIIGWVFLNSTSLSHFDPFPFILLNLAFSIQAAYSAPIILMSANRQTKIDRERDDSDFRFDKDTNERIKELEIKIDLLLKNSKYFHISSISGFVSEFGQD